MDTGWYVGVDYAPVDTERISSDPERLNSLHPGIKIPETSRELVEILQRGIERSKSARANQE
jgi:hypothetical protein